VNDLSLRSGTGTLTCEDGYVALAPQQYDYVVVLSTTNGAAGDWPEEVPAASGADIPYRIKVAIPPDNMVLVHRDSANYEMCQLMGKTSDPLNHQRCLYSGPVGQTQYSGFTSPSVAVPTPLALNPAYYDFGYNLFVDRFEAACNWTQTSTGLHGPGYSSNPDGQVHFNPNYEPVSWNNGYDYSPGCSVYVGSTGYSAGDPTLSTSYRSLVITNDPGAPGFRKPPLLMTQNSAAAACSSVVDPSYHQPKRLLRRREFVAAAATPWLVGEPRSLLDSDITHVSAGASTTTVSKPCNSAGTSLPGATPFTVDFNGSDHAVNATTSGTAAYNGWGFNLIGSSSSSQCVSRFGAQDMIGNADEFVSDQLTGCVAHFYGAGGTLGGNAVYTTCSNATTTPLDPYNGDLNLAFDGSSYPGGIDFEDFADGNVVDRTAGGTTVDPFNGQLLDPTTITGDSLGANMDFAALYGFGLATTSFTQNATGVSTGFVAPMGIPLAPASAQATDSGMIVGSGISRPHLHNDSFMHGLGFGYFNSNAERSGASFSRAITSGGGSSQTVYESYSSNGYDNLTQANVAANTYYQFNQPIGGPGRFSFNSFKEPGAGGLNVDQHAGFRCAMPAE
jgi:hypothetical protein